MSRPATTLRRRRPRVEWLPGTTSALPLNAAAITSSGVLGPLNEDVRDLRPAEFLGRAFAGLEHLADLGAARGDLVRRAVRAGFRGDDRLALVAPRGVLELQDRHADVLGQVELVEDL